MYCRFCGNQIPDDSMFCLYCGEKLSEGCISPLLPPIEKARILVNMGKYSQAIEIYLDLIAVNPVDINANIGILRICSGNFSTFSGEYKYHLKNDIATVCHFIDIEGYIKKVSQLIGSNQSGDREYDDFIKRYQNFVLERQIRQKREKEELEQREKARKRGLAEKINEKIKKGEETRLTDRYESFSSFVEAIQIAEGYGVELPEDFMHKFAKSLDAKAARITEPVMRYYERLAEEGNCTAQYYLYYITSPSGRADNWLRKAADNGSPEALCEYGRREYSNGLSASEPSKSQYYMNSFCWYQKAVEKGSKDAMSILGWKFYLKGVPNVVEKDIKKALELCKKADDFYTVATIYHNDLNDPRTALEWYKKDTAVNDFLSIARIYESLNMKQEAIKYYQKCIESKAPPQSEAQKALNRLLGGN